ncbi:MAG: Smr/MutS family protein [Pseudolabrys sp.]
MSGRRRRGLTRDEHELWTVFTKKIAPLRVPRPESSDDEDEPEPPPKIKPAAATSKTRAARSATKAAPRSAAKPQPAPSLEALGRRMKQRVVRGRDAIDGRLDLHGMTQSEAHPALLRFLRNASAREAKLVLVITGKGFRAEQGGDRERGVLRRQVPHWLNLPEFRAFVIGFEEAHVAHGGEGALYVRVRRARH